MPCPHNEITIVQRSQRQSAVAAPAGELTLPASTCTFIVLCTVNKTATSRLPQVHLCKQVRLTCRRDVFSFSYASIPLPFLILSLQPLFQCRLLSKNSIHFIVQILNHNFGFANLTL